MRTKNHSIIPKPHAHLHSMQKTSAKFQNNRWKTVRGVVPTRYPLSIHFDSISYQNKTMIKFTKQKNSEKIIKGLYSHRMHTFISCRKICNVSKHSTENCKSNCTHKVPSIFSSERPRNDRTIESQSHRIKE